MVSNIDLYTAQLEGAAMALAEDFSDAAEQAQKKAASLSAQLFVLQMNCGKLKAALGRAAAPIGQVFLPAMNQGILAATRFVKSAGAVIAALLGGTAGTDALADSAENAAGAEKTLTKTSTSAAKAVKRALAGFDELEVLKFSGGSGSGSAAAEDIVLPTVRDSLTPELQAIVDKIQAVLAPLRIIDFSPAQAAFARLGQAAKSLGAALASGLEWAWYNLLTPLAKWVIEKAAPASLDVLTSAVSALTAVLGPVQAGLQSLLSAMQPVFSFLAGAAITALESVKTAMEQVGQVFTEKSGAIQETLANLGQAVTALWGRLEPILSNWMSVFSAGFTYIGAAVSTCVGMVIDILSGLGAFLAGAFTGDWNRACGGITAIFSAAAQAVSAQAANLKAFLAAAWPAIAANASLAFSQLKSAIVSVFTGLPSVVKAAVNGVIGLVNGMVSAVASGFNSVIRAVNALHFDVPSWVPGLGGKRFGVSLGYVSAPQIPYLAQGAVLPANRPFLAVVGDQKNGTNVEAPLDTIRQAVASVLADGQAEQAALLRQILQAVLGIEVGDTVIGQAAARYQRKMAVVTGGMV